MNKTDIRKANPKKVRRKRIDPMKMHSSKVDAICDILVQLQRELLKKYAVLYKDLVGDDYQDHIYTQEARDKWDKKVDRLYQDAASLIRLRSNELDLERLMSDETTYNKYLKLAKNAENSHSEQIEKMKKKKCDKEEINKVFKDYTEYINKVKKELVDSSREEWEKSLKSVSKKVTGFDAKLPQLCMDHRSK